jgi:hypothetical protein
VNDRRPPVLAVALALAGAVAVASCSSSGAERQTKSLEDLAPSHTNPYDYPHQHGGTAPGGAEDVDVPTTPLRTGERYVDVAMPAPYEPEAPGSGTDDYRCFLLDPGFTEDTFVTGIDILPGTPSVVHHVILFRVAPDKVAQARRADREVPEQGWTCFGGSGLDDQAASLDNAPWLGAWAPGGGERVMSGGVGIPVTAGSQIVMQVHYNLIDGSSPDVTSARLRVAGEESGLEALETMLLPAPVELPCRPGVEGRLCDRETAVLDVMGRFGMGAGRTVAGLQLLCGEGAGVTPGPVQRCVRRVNEPATVHAVAGHMHLLGREISIEAETADGRRRMLLELPVWDFDDQGTRPLAKPMALEPGDTLTVTCRHDQGLRDLLPAFEGQEERYVVWGEGTTDEMCLGIALVTRP